MSDTPPAFAPFAQGLDFLKGWTQQAGQAMPAMGQWIAPTLDPDELDKRIEELRTVQFWLEQNARLLGTTIQALEVQKMTLSTLKGMNLQMQDLQASLRTQTGRDRAAAKPAAPAPKAAPAAEGGAGTDGAAPMVDPMKWWGALTQQFGEIAARALATAPGAGDAVGAPAAKPSTRTGGKAAAPKTPAKTTGRAPAAGKGRAAARSGRRSSAGAEDDTD